MTIATVPAARITESEVIGLLARHRPGRARPADSVIHAWHLALAGYTSAECHAALTTMGPAAARVATPSEITGRVDAARDRATTDSPTRADDTAADNPSGRSPRKSQRDTEREYYRQAGMRGIRTVYSAMRWDRNADHDLARSVPCPFCKARTWVVCGPLTRNRHGVREQRDPVHGMHPSRFDRARADLARSQTTASTDRETSR